MFTKRPLMKPNESFHERGGPGVSSLDGFQVECKHCAKEFTLTCQKCQEPVLFRALCKCETVVVSRLRFYTSFLFYILLMFFGAMIFAILTS